VSVGTLCTLRMYAWEGSPPVEGDLLRTRAGSCYRIEEVKPSRSPNVLYSLRVMRLGKDAVQFGQDGVRELYWLPRAPRSI
jgi:hypothetical protein